MTSANDPWFGGHGEPPLGELTFFSWREMAGRFPEFVQWVAQTYGPPLGEYVLAAEACRWLEAYGAALKGD